MKTAEIITLKVKCSIIELEMVIGFRVIAANRKSTIFYIFFNNVFDLVDYKRTERPITTL